MTCNYRHKCEHCGDDLIHQTNRGMNESSSAFGQHIHDNYETTFWWIDIDGIIYKKTTHIFRVIENKSRDGNLRPSQKYILPLLATIIMMLIYLNILHKESGVFLVKSDKPFDTGEIIQILPGISYHSGESIEMDKDKFDLFKSGEILDYA